MENRLKAHTLSRDETADLLNQNNVEIARLRSELAECRHKNMWLVNNNLRLEKALERIVNQEPCCDGAGYFFYPQHDGNGNCIGEQQVDPLLVIQVMAKMAQDALLDNTQHVYIVGQVGNLDSPFPTNQNLQDNETS